MNINTIREYFDFLVNKYQNGDISGEEFSMLFNDSQLDYFSFLLGLPEQFQYGRPVPRVGIGMGKVVSKSLDPFIEIVEIQLIPKPAPTQTGQLNLWGQK